LQEWLDQLFRNLWVIRQASADNSPEVLREHRKVIAQTALPLSNFVASLKTPLSEESVQGQLQPAS
jgi:hypothetical protein